VTAQAGRNELKITSLMHTSRRRPSVQAEASRKRSSSSAAAKTKGRRICK